MSEQSTFGSRLRTFRKTKKLSGEELGAVVGIGRGQVSSIENNKSMLTLEGCIKICTTYPDLDANWLITGQGEMLKEEVPTSGDCWPLLQAERNKSEALEALLSKHGIIK